MGFNPGETLSTAAAPNQPSADGVWPAGSGTGSALALLPLPPLRESQGSDRGNGFGALPDTLRGLLLCFESRRELRVPSSL